MTLAILIHDLCRGSEIVATYLHNRRRPGGATEKGSATEQSDTLMHECMGITLQNHISGIWALKIGIS